MIAVGEDDLICDLAETYGIYDMRSMPATTIAVLANGLRPESRTMSKLSENEVDLDRLFRARMVDLLSILVWQRTKDGMNGKNAPQLVTDILLGNAPKKRRRQLKSFKTPEDFHAAWRAGGGG